MGSSPSTCRARRNRPSGIARALPVGAVRSLSIFCRAPNPYPLDDAGDAHAVPLDTPAALAAWT